MKLFDTDVIIQRGEAFQLNFEIFTPQGTPYIIPADINNPYFVLTVASSGNYTNGRYKKDWWMLVDDSTPRFTYTEAFDIRKFYMGPSRPFESWDDVVGLVSIVDYDYPEYGTFVPSLDAWQNHVYTEMVFYGPDSTGKIVYKYWQSDADNAFNGRWIDYNLILSFIIMPSDSQELISQNYLYGVSLQAGISTKEAYNDDTTFDYVYGKTYEYILENFPEIANRLTEDEKLLNNITNSIPLYSLDYVVPIVEPSKLTVNTNLKGGILK